MAYLLARVENFPRFDGESLTANPVMRFGQGGGIPHEIHNFSIASDGFIYGYLPKEGGGDLSRLGGDSATEEVSNVTIIFISSGILCGYYRDATVFSNLIRHPDKLKAGKSEIFSRVKVDPKNAFLVRSDKRNDELQPKPQGQFPVLYGDKNPEWIKWFEGLDSGNHISLEIERKRIKWAKRVERSSKAREMAINEYGHKCECCEISHKDNIRAAVFEVHHKMPYAENFETRRLEVSDLAVLCANCHRMIHKMPDFGDIEALKAYQA